MQDTASSTSKQRQRGGIGRIVSFTGILILFVSFFLPHVEGCQEGVVPAEMVRENALSIFTLALPFLFALLMAVIYLVRWLLRSEKARRALAVVGCLICVAILAYAAIGSLVGAHSMLQPEQEVERDELLWVDLTWLLAAAAGAACVFAIVASVPRKLPGCVFFCGLSALGYFLYWPAVNLEGIYYGLWVSVAASVLIAIGGLWEAIGVRRQIPQAPQSA